MGFRNHRLSVAKFSVLNVSQNIFEGLRNILITYIEFVKVVDITYLPPLNFESLSTWGYLLHLLDNKLVSEDLFSWNLNWFLV